MNRSLIRFFLERVLYALPVLFVVLAGVFFLIHLVPGDPLQQMVGERAQPAELQQLRHQLGLDQPLAIQFLHYTRGVLHGDLGTSFRFGVPVSRLILSRYPATLLLTLSSLAVALLLSLPAGVQSALHRGQWADHLLGFGSLLGLSFPNFALAPVAILLFSIELGWLPVSGYGGLAHLILPAITLGTALAAILTRLVRAAMLEELHQDYVRTARAKGAAETAVLYRHALRNALISVVTVAGLQFGALLSGAMVTETIFSWPGIGRLTLQAINSRDYPLVQGCFLAIAVTYIVVNLLTDLVYTLADPRIREV